MRSFTEEEVRQYCDQRHLSARISANGELYPQTTLPRIVIKAPTEMRQAIIFMLTLVELTNAGPFKGGLTWLRIYDVGVLESFYLGWKTLESIRIANGDDRTLKVAPAQSFDKNDENEIKLFLLQSLLFGWNGLFLPDGLNCGIQSTSSHTWFFYSDRQSDLETLFQGLEPWAPSYEETETH